jgi:hypothetical protein
VFGDIWQTQKIYGSATAVDPADGSTTIGRGSEGHNRKARKDCAIEAVIQGEQAESASERMSPIKKSARIRRGWESRCFLRRVT